MTCHPLVVSNMFKEIIHLLALNLHSIAVSIVRSVLCLFVIFLFHLPLFQLLHYYYGFAVFSAKFSCWRKFESKIKHWRPNELIVSERQPRDLLKKNGFGIGWECLYKIYIFINRSTENSQNVFPLQFWTIVRRTHMLKEIKPWGTYLKFWWHMRMYHKTVLKSFCYKK